MRILQLLAGTSLCFNMAWAQEGETPPFECDNNFGQCGTPNMSGGGGGGGGGAVLIANTDLGDTYQHADDFDEDWVIIIEISMRIPAQYEKICSDFILLNYENNCIIN